MNRLDNTVRVLLLGLLISVAVGCATGRMADLQDCGKLSLGFGPGLGADIAIGSLTHPSIGIMTKTHRVGFEGRDLVGRWTEMECLFPVAPVLGALSEADPWGISYFRAVTAINGEKEESRMHPQEVDRWINFNSERNPKVSHFKKATDFQVGVSAFLSVRLGLNPLEIVDFLLGFAGIDIASDDKFEYGDERYWNHSGP